MIFVINVTAIYASFSLNHMNAIYWGAILPVLYAIVVAPHALIGRPGMPRAAITKALIAKWNNADDLSRYIIQYWMALAYPSTSWKKRRNSVTLYLTSFFLCACYFAKESFVAGLIMFLAGYVLYQMSLRVDRPRLVYANPEFRVGGNDESSRREWELAAMSIIAFADLYPDDGTLKESANQVSEDGDVKFLLAHHRYDHGASWAS
ncbi:hypothetical protein [Nitrosovibrio tenuis]|uniref:Uncharacterized protein n=1 Tax=Nitrosovibrio tenuis TaxID=1233 RepID=A0A1H7KN00_9PROT|nr:hypothetical protein [Nitrosovibrio tenuis]SEK88211.1 hypothetical protein SAMN05216387_103285 [Nitrosovibrio tenuis]